MSLEFKILAAVSVLSVLIILAVMARSNRFFHCFLNSALSGCAALFAINLLSDFIGFSLKINPTSIAVSSIGGIPGVVMLLIARTLIL